jgi:hypothetical protein
MRTPAHRLGSLSCAVLSLLISVFCAAQTPSAPASSTQIEPSRTLAGPIRLAERAVVSLAEAMPEDKYSFAPSSGIFIATQKTEYVGVRTFGEQVAHIASSNYEYLQAMGIKTDRDPEAVLKLKSKAELVQALKDSYIAAKNAVATFTTANVFEAIGPQKNSTRANYAAAIAWHSMDHYGQMVEYARMNGTVPPESKK